MTPATGVGVAMRMAEPLRGGISVCLPEHSNSFVIYELVVGRGAVL